MAFDSGSLETAKVHLQRGQFPATEQVLREILQAEPHHAEAWSVLGIALGQQQKLEESAGCFRRSLEIQPNSVDTQINLGVTLLRQRRLDEALNSLRSALALKPDSVLALSYLGDVLSALGQLDQAIDSYRAALRIDPHFVKAYIHLALQLKEQGQLEQSAECLRQAHHLLPHSVEVLVNLGHCLRAQVKMEEALAVYEQAIRLRPQFAEGHCYWAAALTELGGFEHAVEHFREALRLKPGLIQALSGLGELAQQGKYRFTDEERDWIPQLLARNDLPLRDRIALHFVQAGLLDQEGAYAEAFAHYQQGDTLRRPILQAQGLAFDAQKHRAKIETTIAEFDREYFQQVEGFGLKTDLPVFIVGVPRSGTSLIEQILASHPLVFGAGELTDILRIASSLMGGKDGQSRPPRRLGLEESRSLAEAYVRRLTDLGGSATRVTDKFPENYLHLGIVFTLFPQARVIHCRRNAMDVCLSCYAHNFAGHGFASSLEDLGQYYLMYERLMAHWRTVLPRPILEVDYEELVANQEAVSRRLVAFCGLDWDERCLAFYSHRRAVRTPSKVQVRRPMYTDAVGRWKRYAPFLKPLADLLSERGSTT
jgi:tetratricopeptide (TPR) repeat protein